MPVRAHDGFRQAEADLRHARHARGDRDHEWARFAAQQAAEKAVRAVYDAHHLEGWGHTISTLLGNLPDRMKAPAGLVAQAKSLDEHHIPTRYPNGFDSGAPTDVYTAAEADRAIQDAAAIVEFCRQHLPPPPGA